MADFCTYVGCTPATTCSKKKLSQYEIEYNNKGSLSECSAGVKKLAISHGVTAIIGHFNSSCARAIIDLVNNLKIPLLTPAAMSDEINLKDDYIFRNTLGIQEAENKINSFCDFKNGKYIMLDGFNVDSFDRELGELAQGCLFSTQWHLSFSTPMSDLFMKLYTKKFKDVPDMFSAISYEGTYILYDSLIKTESYYGKDNFKQYL